MVVCTHVVEGTWWEGEVVVVVEGGEVVAGVGSGVSELSITNGDNADKKNTNQLKIAPQL